MLFFGGDCHKYLADFSTNIWRANLQKTGSPSRYERASFLGSAHFQAAHRGEVNIINALDVLQERLGPGFYQFEFCRRLRALRKDSDAASH